MDYNFLANTVLFRGTSPDQVRSMLGCMNSESRLYHKGSYIYRAGDTASSVGLVLSGGVYIETDDVWGNKSILDKAVPGQVFAESYACVPGARLMVSVVAAEESEILFMDISRMLNVCSNACAFHTKLIRNLLSVASQKNLNLSWRIFHTSSKSIRGRLLSYLSFQARQHGAREFDIPFNRQQMADYLSVDRSAMSNELGKMQREGLLQVERSHFVLLGMDTENADKVRRM